MGWTFDRKHLYKFELFKKNGFQPGIREIHFLEVMGSNMQIDSYTNVKKLYGNVAKGGVGCVSSSSL